MRILICGGRDYGEKNETDKALFVDAWAKLMAKHGNHFVVINGGCRTGADKMARAIALGLEMECITVPAKFKTMGRCAGPARNQHMIDEYKPQAGVAFPGGTGTADMVRRLRAAGIPVWIPYGGVAE